IAGVGFDLYVRLVGEAVDAFRRSAGAEPAEGGPAEVRVDLPVDAHIPLDYVSGERLRLEAYRKIAAASQQDGVAAIDEVRDELTDRYGSPPAPVERLLKIAGSKQVCRAAGVTEVSLQGNNKIGRAHV